MLLYLGELTQPLFSPPTQKVNTYSRICGVQNLSSSKPPCTSPSLELRGTTSLCKAYKVWKLWSALYIQGFCIPVFNQPQIENSIFNPWLEIWGFRGPTTCIVLFYFIERTWASTDFGIWGPGTNTLQILKNDYKWPGCSYAGPLPWGVNC